MSLSPADNMAKIFTLLVGVALLGAAVKASESESEVPAEEPMGSLESGAQVRQIATPEVVLQLKYDRGELNRIYLAQFRKASKSWRPSVSTRTNLCADLCHAGLGGSACGSACDQMLPIGLRSALNTSVTISAVYGTPRMAVCPSLCDNHLGLPLCSCDEGHEHEDVDWSAVCSAFCEDGYVLAGCPACDSTSQETPLPQSTRALSTYEGWTAWCDVQCRQGQGGAACNCDRAPFQ